MGTTDGGTADGLAAPVEKILAGARTRDRGGERVRVDGRSFTKALSEAKAAGTTPLVAEVKPTSPTADYEHDVDPVATAEAMVEGGATALSVLTEPDYFGGSLDALEAIRAAVSVPVLRKDFLLRESQLDAVRADAVLLIARFLTDLEGMIDAARERGMTPLVETHTREEVRRAVRAGATVIGVNNRDLATLTVDRSTFEELEPAIPADCTAIAESGIETPGHRDQMLEAGADGLLVGSAIMDGDVKKRTETLVGR